MIKNEIIALEEMKRCDPEDFIYRLLNYQQQISNNPDLYYHEKEDRHWIKSYYKNISIRKEVLFKQYHKLVSETHENIYPYFYSKDHFLYTWVDLHPNGKLFSIYSGEPIDSQAMIEQDFITLQKRYDSYHRLFHQDELHEEIDEEMIERLRNISKQHRFNTEHVIPQSWFHAKEPMKGDLHHLFVCEPTCNNLRSNYPFHEYDPSNSSVQQESICGKQDLSGFEPAYGKGIVARATFYFLLRYPNSIHKKHLKRIHLPTLRKWHHQEPVSLYEKHRNKAIYEIQGNRNPFIDIPDLIDHLRFSF
ncbi:endonuclease I family protein [Ornithinibacillus sp. 4-3]|uniref:Endonuclease I family protein n=1 Tax=Ornithinibacillus sp. 4-3 TaxID=3231488 RepID=A0AB39HN13_9BACI